ncbi:bactericidal permeability-increasing protein-like [Anser cygnoides]|uniref:bactericidal permeability-increasing protein-like n=1 Tax=Anser cygnoides TaxID=8845 RepID=UPI0034D17C7C
MGMRSLLVASTVLALGLALTGATNPGFVVRITQAGLDYAKQHGVAVLEKELAQLKLQDISGESRIPVLGKVRYEISRLNLRNFQLPHSQISLVPNEGLQVSISNAFAELDGNWRVKLRFLRHHGSFNLNVEHIYIKTTLKLGRDASGKPTIDVSACSTSISNVRVRFSGKLSWLYNLFRRTIESKLKKNLEDKVCESLSSSVRRYLQPYLQTVPVTAKIDTTVGIDYSLTAPPVATAQFLNADLKGECFSLAQHTAIPFTPPALAFPPDHSRMVYFGVSSYFFNTASFAYHTAGALVFEITDSMIPKDIEFRLNTSTFAAFLPQLDEMYPNMPMKLRLSAPSAPFLSIGPDGVSLQPVVDIQAYAIYPNGSLAPLFLLSLTGNVSATADVRSGRMVGSLALGRMKLTLKHSDVGTGTFKVKMMQSIMNIVASSVLLPRLNERLGKGFPLPLPAQVQLSDLLVQFHENFLLFGANVHYQPRQGR